MAPLGWSLLLLSLAAGSTVSRCRAEGGVVKWEGHCLLSLHRSGTGPTTQSPRDLWVEWEMGPSLPSPVPLQSVLQGPFMPQMGECYQNQNGVIDVYLTNKSRDCEGRGLKHGCLIGAPGRALPRTQVITEATATSAKCLEGQLPTATCSISDWHRSCYQPSWWTLLMRYENWFSCSEVPILLLPPCGPLQRSTIPKEPPAFFGEDHPSYPFRPTLLNEVPEKQVF